LRFRASFGDAAKDVGFHLLFVHRTGETQKCEECTRLGHLREALAQREGPLAWTPAARAARCAADQDKFWKFHDALFLDQKKLDPDNLKQTAAKVGLDRGKFNACFSSDRQDAGIRKDMEEGNALGVTGTPTFFINGRELVGAQPAPKFNEVINEELARAKASNSRQAMR